MVPVAHHGQNSTQEMAPVAHRGQNSAQEMAPVAHRWQNDAQEMAPVAHRGQNGAQEMAPAAHPGRSAAHETAPTARASRNALTTGSTEDDPGSYRDALNSSLNKQWKEAMRQEYASLIENSTFTPVTNTNGMKPIGCRWVYKTKRNPNGTIRYKARLVIKGYEQIRGVDFDETYAPVGKLITLRYLLSFAAQNSYKIDHLDVVTAFLNPEIDTEVYMQLPEGIEWLESTAMPSGNRDCFLRLNKALYGLRQAPRLWHQEIDGFLQSIGFHRSHADISLYIRDDGVLILLYVDDILVFYAEEASEKAL